MREQRPALPAFEPPGAEPPEPAPAPSRRSWAPIAVGVGVALLVVLVILAALLLPGLLATSAEPRWERQAWRVSDQTTADYLDAQLQRGWEVERADSDGQGTTYVLRRDPALPTPVPRPREQR